MILGLLLLLPDVLAGQAETAASQPPRVPGNSRPGRTITVSGFDSAAIRLHLDKAKLGDTIQLAQGTYTIPVRVPPYHSAERFSTNLLTGGICGGE
jgi:hypothetical protein